MNSSSNRSRVANAGLLLGPLLAILVYFLLPDVYLSAAGEQLTLGPPAHAAAAAAVLMAVWWMTEAIPLYATALIPLALFPLLGVADIRTTATPYGHEIIFLFMGGFIVALALEKWNLHKRIALTVLAAVGPSPQALVGAFMFVAAFLSMWVTNTATTLMLLPVAVSVVSLLAKEQGCENDAENFSASLLLGIAYAASIGGMGTIVGTAPNLFVVSFLSEELGREISFIEWMKFGVPMVIILLPTVWFMLTRVVYRIPQKPLQGAQSLLTERKNELQALSRGEWLTLIVFVGTALTWMSRPLLQQWEIGSLQPFAGLTDTGVAVIAALLLFVTPVNLKERVFLMDWPTAVRLPWGLLILFGGGLSLAAGISASGLAEFIGHQASGLGDWPVWMLIVGVTALVIFLTEMTSNFATTATIVPVLLAVALALGLPPMALIMPAAFAVSCAFMLPVATPPNAIVFGSGLITIRQMSRAGFWLNLIAIGLVTLASYTIVFPLLGVSL